MSEPPSSLSPDEHPNALPVGTRLGEFEIKGVIGAGGFGIVYLAYDRHLQFEVAIKEYMPEQFAYRAQNGQISLRTHGGRETFGLGLGKFVEEARFLAKFDHPTLVKVLRYLEANGTAYMVMTYYKGVTLRAYRDSLKAPPDQAWIMSLVEPLLGALEMLHRESIYHRDISPDNILLQSDGKPVLLDFGAARRVVANRTQRLTTILKPDFAPVEQYGQMPGLDQGPWTDLYALAAVVYFCIAGQPPPPSINRMVKETMQPFSGVAEQMRVMHGRVYDKAFLSAWQHAIAVMPDQRTRSVEQLQRELSGRQRAAPDSAPRPATSPAAAPTPWASSIRSNRRWPLWVGIGMAVVLLGVFAFIVAGQSGRSDKSLAAPASAVVPAARIGVEAGPREMAEADARAKAEADARAKAEADARAKAEADARAKAEADARAKAEADARVKARAKAEADARAKAEADARVKVEADARAKAEADARAKAEADARAKAEADARAKVDGGKGGNQLAYDPESKCAVETARAGVTTYKCMLETCRKDVFKQHPKCIEFTRKPR